MPSLSPERQYPRQILVAAIIGVERLLRVDLDPAEGPGQTSTSIQAFVQKFGDGIRRG